MNRIGRNARIFLLSVLRYEYKMTSMRAMTSGSGKVYNYSGTPKTNGVTDFAATRCTVMPEYFTFEECHPLFSLPKGLATIINNRRFQQNSPNDELTERHGTDVDCANMNKLLTQLGYQVSIYSDLPAKEMREAMTRFSKDPQHQRCASAICVVLSHGSDGEIVGSDGERVPLDSLITELHGQQCPSLLNKPKMFFVQACRGHRHDEGVAPPEGTNEATVSPNETELLKKLLEWDDADRSKLGKTPSEADIVVSYSTVPGYISWRHTMSGSWYIQAICEVFSRLAHKEDVLRLLTDVHRRVAQQITPKGYKQVPGTAFSLTKHCYFLPGIYEKEKLE